MKNWHKLVSILFFALAVVIFVFASGARRIYSGLFFAIMGTVIYLNSYWTKKKK